MDSTPSIQVTSFGSEPRRVSFKEFAEIEVQDYPAALDKAEDILRDGEADNGQEEHWAYQEYELYDKRALTAQIEHERKKHD